MDPTPALIQGRVDLIAYCRPTFLCLYSEFKQKLTISQYFVAENKNKRGICVVLHQGAYCLACLKISKLWVGFVEVMI